MGTKQQLQVNNTGLRSNQEKILQNIRTIQSLPVYQSPIGKYVWKVYNKDTQVFIGYIAGDSEDKYPTAGVQGDYLYVRNFASIEELTWAQIAEIVHCGYADTILTLKDGKKVTLTTGEVVTFEIVGFNCDKYSDNTVAPVTFLMRDMLSTVRRMNSSNTTAGGYDAMEIFSWLQNDLYGQLPSDLQGLIKSTNKICTTGGTSATLKTVSCKLWQPSGWEMFGTANTNYYATNEGTHYPIFTDNASRIKNRNGTANTFWLRSPGLSYASYFCYVYYDGTIGSLGASYAIGVVVGFCI